MTTNDVALTSMYGDYVASTSVPRHFNVMCPVSIAFVVSDVKVRKSWTMPL